MAKTDIIERNGYNCTQVKDNCVCVHDIFIPSTMDHPRRTVPKPFGNLHGGNMEKAPRRSRSRGAPKASSLSEQRHGQ